MYSKSVQQRFLLSPSSWKLLECLWWMRTSRQARWTSLMMQRAPDSTDCFRRRQLSSRVAKRTLPSKHQHKQTHPVTHHFLPIDLSSHIFFQRGKMKWFRFTAGHSLARLTYHTALIYASLCCAHSLKADKHNTAYF